ncbi:hypothetical protein NCG97_25815 [Streptomyces lydicamycinicus]|uniref:hypothetical protein n=1 Tax=Streptomyces lydicamycinicus TaxID=1546107 RepID=UPI0020360BD6|nr:hypothetical protein [Streptomyces lydicamycinicus]USA03283.1 hypothetical protein NCG97_25815 [Streptomyces lydicamycinicus]
MTDDIQQLIQQLCSSGPDEWETAERALCELGPQAVEYLLPLLADSTGNGGVRAQSCLSSIGSGAVPVLQRIRRQGPGRLRRPALQALAELAGGQEIAERDLKAIERLVRVKLVDEQPDELPVGGWLAVRGAQVNDIVQALELGDVRPATVAMGISAAVESENSIEIEGEEERAYRVFITPEFDEWRLIYGDDFINDNWANAVQKLSARCNEAHFYLVDDFDGNNVWWVARNGEDHRGYRTYGDPEWIGDPMPFERSLMVDEDDPLYDPEEHGDYAEGVTDPESVASWISIPPTTISIAEKVGHGWIAVAGGDVTNAAFKGALQI